MKYHTTTIRNDIEYGVTDIISPIKHRIDELEDRVAKLEEKEATISDWFEQPKTASQITELLKEEEAKAEKAGADSK